jgi:hypothetical protein
MHASQITRWEMLTGMRRAGEDGTRSLRSTSVWHPVDAEVAEEARFLGPSVASQSSQHRQR